MCTDDKKALIKINTNYMVAKNESPFSDYPGCHELENKNTAKCRQNLFG